MHARRIGTVAVLIAAVSASAGGVVVSISLDANSHAADAVCGAVAVLAFAVVGAVVVAARPTNPVGWVMVAGAAMWAIGAAGIDLAFQGLVSDPGSVPGASAWAVTGSAIRGAGWLLVVVGLPLVFPDGRLIGPRTRWIPVTLLAAMVCSVGGALTATDANLTDLGAWQNPLALPADAQPLAGLLSIGGLILAAAAFVGAAGQLRARWRSGEAQRRQQLSLFGVAASLTVIAAPVAIVSGRGWIFSVAALPLPFAVGFAVLARGLYDLRTAANRTLVWVTLSTAIIGIYALVIAGLGALLPEHRSSWLPWIATAVIAISFAPIRDVLQRTVNKLIFGAWDSPYTVLAALGQRVTGATDAERLLTDVVDELGALGLQGVGIFDAEGALIAGESTIQVREENSVTEIALAAYGRPVGTLRFREPAVPLRTADRQLLTDLAGHLGGVIRTRQLVGDLEHSLERIVLAREEERRRLRRDLHDGLGPALAGHLLRLDVIATRLDQELPASREVSALRDDLSETVLDVRRLVEGLRPPALDELGLISALQQVLSRMSSGSAVSVDLDVGALPTLSAAVEVAVYRIATEAVNNSLRHSGATSCRVTLAAADGLLHLAITDDGTGMDCELWTAGHGLQTMRERAAELRGRLTVTSAAGTTIDVEFPLNRTTQPSDRPLATLAP